MRRERSALGGNRQGGLSEAALRLDGQGHSRRTGRARPSLADVLLDAREELLHVERLADRIARSELAELRSQRVDLLDRRDDDDRRLHRAIELAAGPQEVDAARPGKEKVQKDEIDLALAEDAQPFLRVARERDLVTPCVQDDPKQMTRAEVVFNHEDAAPDGHGISVMRAAPRRPPTPSKYPPM